MCVMRVSGRTWVCVGVLATKADRMECSASVDLDLTSVSYFVGNGAQY